MITSANKIVTVWDFLLIFGSNREVAVKLSDRPKEVHCIWSAR